MKYQKVTKAIILLLLVASASCTKQTESTVVDDGIKKEQNRRSFKDNANRSQTIDLLTKDESFKKYNAKLKEYTYHFLSRKHKKGEKMRGNAPKDAKAALIYYKDQGFQDPLGFMRTKLEMIYYYSKVIENFPELKELTPDMRQAVFSEAAPIKFSSSELRNISAIVKANKESF